jgi:NAD(P)-dependent dehydrogenase (short-subunit alcohol dehydrogenase family)
MDVVVVTGCSSGIGLETCIAFGRTGARVYATMRDRSRAARLRAAAEAVGVEVQVVELDVTQDRSVALAAELILDDAGAVDVVVNNAGIGRVGAIEDLAESEARDVFETNFWGPLRVVRAFLPSLRARRSGAIINVSSMAGRLPPVPTLGFYGASKHALGAMSEALRYEVARYGIRVVLIEPGMHHSEVEANLPLPDGTSVCVDLATRAHGMTVQGVRRGADAADVAQAIVAAAGDGSTPPHVLVGADAHAAVAQFELNGVVGFDRMVTAVFGVDTSATSP